MSRMIHIVARAALLLASLAVTLASAQPNAAGPSPPLPLETFFGQESLGLAKLSPSGRWLGALVTAAGTRTRLVLMDLQGKEPPKVLAAFNGEDVIWFRWLNEEVLLFSVSDRTERSNLNRYQGLASVTRDGQRMRLLIKREFETEYPARAGALPLEGNHWYLAPGAPGTDDVIVGELIFGVSRDENTVRPMVLDARTGARRSLLASPPPGVQDWVFDRQGRARVAIARNRGRTAFFWQELTTGEWREIGNFASAKSAYWPRYVDTAGQLYVDVSAGAEGSAELRRFDLDKGEISSTVIAATPGFDGSIDMIQDEQNGEFVGVSVLVDAPATVWLTPAMKQMQETADALLPGRVNLLSCRPDCRSPQVVLVHSSSDRFPGEYLVYRLPTQQWERIGLQRPAVDPQRMAGKEFHRIQARDGADLPVWVTRPASPAGAPARPRPAVVMVHGGPWSRGTKWDWDANAQFLASRGYVVVEPEFRGSTGYGSTHYRAGWKQWGQAMQDDVTDALRFAVAQGWVDASRVCIAGASYGGYATLMGLAKDPDQYRCGVAWVAVSDPRLMFSIHWSDISDGSKRYNMPQMIGDPKADAAMLAANSPLELAGRIKAPVLLAYGAKDVRVPIDHGERMRAALRKAGREPEWVVYQDEGHGWLHDENTLDFWKRVETFLARHLAP